MTETLTTIADTAPLWVPVLSYLTGRLSATRPGRTIENILKNKLSLVKDTTTERAFREAFEAGAKQFEKTHGDSVARLAVARVLAHIAEHGETSSLDQTMILEQLFVEYPNLDELSHIVKRYTFVLQGVNVSTELVAETLHLLIADYLRPAFRAHPHFTERVALPEIVGLLRDIRDAVQKNEINLEQMRADYLMMVEERYREITIQGISPSIGTRTIGMSMQDVFIPMEMQIDSFDIDTFLSSLYDENMLSESHKVNQHDAIVNLLSKYRNLKVALVGTTASQSDYQVNSEDVLTSWRSTSGTADMLLYYIDHCQPVSEDQRTLTTSIQLKSHFVRGSGGTGRSSFLTNLRDYWAHELLRYEFSIRTFSLFPRLVVQGDPGGGKSTLLRYVAWAIAEQRDGLLTKRILQKLPIYMRAVEFGDAVDAGRVASLDEYLAEQAGRFGPLIKQALASGSAFVLLDGLDEVSRLDLRERVKNLIDVFIADPIFTDIRIIITTRIIGYERSGVTGRFAHFTLTELNNEQIQGFVRNWYQSIHRNMPADVDVDAEAHQLLRVFASVPGIQRMARNPLLLTIITLLKWQGRVLPEQRIQLYDIAAQTLIKSWPATHRRVALDEQLIREWLEPVAMHILIERTGDLIDQYTLFELLVERMQTLKAMSRIDARSYSQTLLDDVSRHSGIILQRGWNAEDQMVYGFLHQTFAEYLAASSLAGRYDDGTLDVTLYAHDPYWREVLLLTAGQLATFRREKSGRFVRQIWELQSSQFEKFIHRDLLVACAILADGVPISPGSLVEDLLTSLLNVWQDTPYIPLRDEITAIVSRLAQTSYESVLVQKILSLNLNDAWLLMVAQHVGGHHFKDRLIDLFRCADETLREQVIDLIGTSGPEGVQFLVDYTQSAAEEQRFYPATILARHNEEVGINVLKELLDASDGRVRFRAASVLIRLGDMTGLDVIRSELRDYKFVQLRQALKLLLDCKNKHADQIITNTLADADEATRQQVASALIEMKDKRGNEVLITLLDSQDTKIQYYAAQQLARQGNERSIELLTFFLESDEPAIRFESACALTELNNERGKDFLVVLLQSHDDEVALYAADQEFTVDEFRLFVADRLLMVDDMRAITQLRQINSEQSLLKLAVYLSSLKNTVQQLSSNAIHTAEQLLDAHDELIQVQAAAILAKQSQVKAITKAVQLLSSQSVEVRFLSMRVLASHSSPPTWIAISELIDTLLQDVQPRSHIRMSEPNLLSPVDSSAQSVGDLAYLFLRRYLSPQGQLVQPAK